MFIKLNIYNLTYVFPIIVMVRVLDSKSKSPRLKSTEWLQHQLILLSCRGWLKEYQELLGTKWIKVNYLLVMAL